MAEFMEFLAAPIELLGSWLHARLIADPFGFPFLETPDDRLYLPYLLSFAALSLVIYLFHRLRRQEQDAPPRSFWKFLFPAQVMLHRSAKLDYKYYVVNRLLGLVFMTGLTGVGAITGAVIVANLEALFGPANLTWSGSALATLGIVYFVVTTLATDLGFFLCHALHHKSKFFWEFHKVHHSAQVLTPITNYRFHPVEKILMVTITGITAGSVIGVFFYLFGDQVGVPNYLLITAANVGVITYGFRFIANHRHSHIWLSFGPKLEHVFISPAQHQIHHSCEARHLDKNLGLQFAIWDWIAGTLYVPNGWELFALGLENDEHEDYDSIRSLYLLPFKRAWAVLGAGQSRAPTASARETGGQ